jgi:hypothetical protein
MQQPAQAHRPEWSQDLKDIFYLNFVCRIRKNGNFPRSSSILLSSYGSNYNPLNKGVLKVSPNHLPHEKRMPDGTLLHDLSATP